MYAPQVKSLKAKSQYVMISCKVIPFYKCLVHFVKHFFYPLGAVLGGQVFSQLLKRPLAAFVRVVIWCRLLYGQVGEMHVTVVYAV